MPRGVLRSAGLLVCYIQDEMAPGYERIHLALQRLDVMILGFPVLAFVQQ